MLLKWAFLDESLALHIWTWSGILASGRALEYSLCFSRLKSHSCDDLAVVANASRKGGYAIVPCKSDRQQAQRTAKINLVQTYGRSLFQTPFVFCRSSDSDTESGTLEALPDVSASATRKEKRRWKMKNKAFQIILMQ
ncbi:unnamed protein product [Soboliphyme baturini]|uniref:POPLD domain-containing protein n=1 Tax=Soboliphyme baturini TaxID=241478 RepID=A0A183IUV5_9BILA|nr:unnamed protein product [Soboliphyme baturini]